MASVGVNAISPMMVIATGCIYTELVNTIWKQGTFANETNDSMLKIYRWMVIRIIMGH